ncbi:tRNA pseudouridine synthase A [Algivirga pacifica]|uniref:tRNA pseudouridine synthase A n=1 Tax=Algivirga pacifica TaxID=1162670 RepID=A0ABP9D9C1_9BACT
MRYFAEVAYHGKAYHGWQVQPNAITVQEVINDVFSKLLRTPIQVTGSGRTDSGVHCFQQYAHFDYEGTLDSKQFLHKANAFLPKDILIRNLYAVTAEAHARFDAISRAYVYKITLRKDPFAQGLEHFLPWTPDLKTLNETSALLLNHIDYTAFSKLHSEVYTHNCDIMGAYWEQKGDKLFFHVKANRFLRGMVRIMTGNLLQVGLGKMTQEQFIQTLETGNRKAAARYLVPGHGLYLNEVIYPEEIFVHNV